MVFEIRAFFQKYFVKAIEHLFLGYVASSKHHGGCHEEFEVVMQTGNANFREFLLGPSENSDEAM